MGDQEEELVPDVDLFESMRAVGYSVETAIADLIDNSLAANSRRIHVFFETEPFLHVAVLDNGDGMDKDTLRTAMTLAGKSPLMDRAANDLGRFGLGLKTASMSQARNLTVITKRQGESLVAARWDLDYIQSVRKWKLKWPDIADEEGCNAFKILMSQASGTLVIWRELDLLLGNSTWDGEEFTELTTSVAEHLSLVFHRFMQQIGAAKVRISVNGVELQPKDPFLENTPGTQIRDEIAIRIGEGVVTAKPYILPEQSRLTVGQRKSALMGESFRETQGFYIYRNKRLLSFGTWFRLTPRSEVAKLARVRVDTPNTLDKEWRLGIMKSAVQPPKVLRDRLRSIVPTIVGDSRRATRGTSMLALGSRNAPWVLRELGDGAFALEVNRDYPLLKALDESLTGSQRTQLANVISFLEELFPIGELVDRFNADAAARQGATFEPDLGALFKALLGINHGDHERAFEELLTTPPVSTSPGLRASVQAQRDYFFTIRLEQ